MMIDARIRHEIRLEQRLIDTRKYEQMISDAGASDYEKAVVSEYGLKHKYFTTFIWGKTFSELFLDYGCGTGVASRTLIKTGRKVVAFDISWKMVSITKETCGVPVIVADALNLPFKNQAFSTICITGVLHHILDLETAFDEIRRCTKDVLCINEPSITESLFLVKLLIRIFFWIIGLNKALHMRAPYKTFLYRGSKYERPLDPNELIQLCKSHGFEILRIRFFNHIPLVHLFLKERIRKHIFKFLISNKRGTHVEIIARLKRQK